MSDTKDHLAILEDAVSRAGLTLIPETSETSGKVAQTDGQTQDGQRIYLFSTEWSKSAGSGEGKNRYVVYQVRVRVTGKLPEGLEIVTWKYAKKRNRTARIRRDSKWLPAPSEGKPVLGVPKRSRGTPGSYQHRRRTETRRDHPRWERALRPHRRPGRLGNGVPLPPRPIIREPSHCLGDGRGNETVTNKDARLRRLEARHGLNPTSMLTDRLVQNALAVLKEDPDARKVDGIPMETIHKWCEAELRQRGEID